MIEILQNISIQQEELQKYLPIPREVIQRLDGWLKAEITCQLVTMYQSSTLTHAEIELILEKGITISGKSIAEHIEAINHAKTLDLIKTLTATSREDLTEDDVLQIHYTLTNHADSQNAGKYRTTTTKISNAPLSLPPPAKIPLLMATLKDQIHRRPTTHPIQNAADIALQLTSIHPFASHNATVARLLMNLLLMQEGYPAALMEVTKSALVKKDPFQTDRNAYYQSIYKGVEKSLDIYLEAAKHPETFFPQRQHGTLHTGDTTESQQKRLLKIGELAKAAGEKVPTIRFWTQEGLLGVAQHTGSGYQLYNEATVMTAKQIRKLQKEKRLTIREIKELLTNVTA